MTIVNAYAAMQPGADLEPYRYDPGPLDPGQVEVEVMACGICHSDLSMIDNDWGIAKFPLVAGHEAVGTVIATGDNIAHLAVGQTVGIGWSAECCQSCSQCVSGKQHRCVKSKPTIKGRHGGFADRIRVDGIWALPLPDTMDAESAGPLFCGGITVFSPFMTYNISPTARVGIIGIGGLGHLAVQIAKAWGCEVTAFTGSMDKEEELKTLGAHRVVNNRDESALKALNGQFDLILSTVNVNLAWHRYLSALAPEGKLVHVGMIKEPMPVSGMQLASAQKLVGGSDTGSPAMTAKMLEFCARHGIKPMVEYFDFKDINAAIAHLKSGKARYRVVLKH